MRGGRRDTRTSRIRSRQVICGERFGYLTRGVVLTAVIPAHAGIQWIPDRIQFTFGFHGVRYRPALLKVPTEANLRRARKQLESIKQRIAAGTFSFAEEFPDFRDLKRLPDGGSPLTRAQVFDAFLAHCDARVAKNDLAPVTVTSYRKVLDGVWRPHVGDTRFLNVPYSTLVTIADRAEWSKKTYNNAMSVRPSEQIALVVQDFDTNSGTLRVATASPRCCAPMRRGLKARFSPIRKRFRRAMRSGACAGRTSATAPLPLPTRVSTGEEPAAAHLPLDLPLTRRWHDVSAGTGWEIHGGKGGTRTRRGDKEDQ